MGKGIYLKPVRLLFWITCFLPTGNAAGTIRAQQTIPETPLLPPSSVKDTAAPLLREILSSAAGDTPLVIPSGDSIVAIPSPDGNGGGGVHPADSGTMHTDERRSLLTPSSDSARVVIRRLKNRKDPALKKATPFKPNPKTAYLVAALFPGFGQAYNRQYWKLPIVYGGLVGFLYAVTWNNKVYQDYRKAYFDIRTDYNHYMEDPDQYGPDTWSTSWQDYFGRSVNTLLNQNNHTRLQKGRDYYRRYRDLSIILSVAFYAICIADAYVDAQMFDFDVSQDLSIRLAPEIYPSTPANSRSFGLNICMTF
jgi:hypothetical protein